MKLNSVLTLHESAAEPSPDLPPSAEPPPAASLSPTDAGMQQGNDKYVSDEKPVYGCLILTFDVDACRCDTVR